MLDMSTRTAYTADHDQFRDTGKALVARLRNRMQQIHRGRVLRQAKNHPGVFLVPAWRTLRGPERKDSQAHARTRPFREFCFDRRVVGQP